MNTCKLLLAGTLSFALASLQACAPVLNTDPVGVNSGTHIDQGLKIEPTVSRPSLPIFATPVPGPSSSAVSEPVLPPTASPSGAITEPIITPSEIPVLPDTTPSNRSTATISGVVYEDTVVPVEDGFVQIKSLNSSVPFEAQVSIVAGAYAIEKVPLGIQMELRVVKPGYTARRQVVVASATANDLGATNTFDFGTYYGAGLVDLKTAISNRPEVESISLTRDATGVALDTDFVLHFSEPMNPDSVIDNFGVYSASTVLLSVDHSPGLSGLDEEELPHSFYGVAEDGNDADTLGDMVGENGTPQNPLRPETTLIWDHDAFEHTWNASFTECRFQFKPGYRLLSDHELARIPDYLITFRAGDSSLRDADGFRRDQDYFKLDAGTFQAYYAFSISGENEKPYLKSIKAVSNEDEPDDGNEVRVVFSEPMVYYTDSGPVKGNMSEKDPDQELLNPDNYWVSVEGNNERRWSELDGARVTVVSGDKTNQTVLLRSSEIHFEKSDDVTIRLDENLVDPAGNEVDNDNDEFTDRAD